MNTFNELLAYIAVNITDAGASYRIIPAIVRNSFNWFIDLVRGHTEDLGIHTTQDDKDAINAHIADNAIHLDPADKLNWDNTATSFIAHENNTPIHTSQAEKDIINTHMSDTVKHVTQADKDKWNNTSVTQAEKNTWNEKALIRGLESGRTESKYNFNFDNAPFVSEYLSPFDSNNLGLPISNSWSIVKTNLNIFGDTGTQIADYFIEGKTYQRVKSSNVWNPWRLISAPKMFATGYIDSVTFNGISNVVKSVLFDDGITRNIVFNKNSPTGYLYNATCTDTNVFISAISGTGIVSIQAENFYLLSYGVNPPLYLTDYRATIASVQVTIKL